VLARATVALLAVALLGWLGVMARDARLAARGVASLRPGSPPGALARAGHDLRGARLLNPDMEPRIDAALLLRARGDVAGAGAAIGDVVRREPDNLVAWGILALLARDRDPAAYARALAARRRLDPLSARRAPPASP
jgi:hypothetical protein